MKIVHVDQLPVEERATKVRVGSHSAQNIMSGEADRIDNFSLRIIYLDEDFYTPRHHHNFDQYRFMIEGDGPVEVFPGCRMTPGVLGYFPEGAYYGPESGPRRKLIAMQFAAPSGWGYLSADQMAEAAKALRNCGVFENGLYQRNEGVPGKRKQDAFEAVWEYVRQRPIEYPKPQYANPILMDTNNYPWMPLAGVPGVAEKALGTFTNCQFRTARYQLDPGASFSGKGRGVYMVLSGSGSVEGEDYNGMTALYLEDGEQGTFVARETTDILLLGLPSMALMGTPPAAPVLQAGDSQSATQ